MHNVDSPDWDGFNQYVEDSWRSKEPVCITEEMKKIIEKETSFSALPIGPIGEHVISDVLHQLMPPAFSNAFIVNSEDDAVQLRKLLTFHNQPQPDIIVYPFQAERYNDNDLPSQPSFRDALNTENTTIANILIDHFGHTFSSGKK